MILPLIDIFGRNEYKVYASPPKPTFKNGILEFLHQEPPIYIISNPYDAANYIANELVDCGLENHIDNYLNLSSVFKDWRRMMPNRTPKICSQYQNSYPNFNQQELENELKNINNFLFKGQVLFHGGYWAYGNELVLSKPLSTSFCPQVALRNGEHSHKAYNCGHLDLWVITTCSSLTPVFSFRIDHRNRMGNEKEVLLNSGAKLTLKSITDVRKYKVRHYSGIEKTIMVRIIDLDLDNYC